MSARDNILARVRQALQQPTAQKLAKPDFTQPIYQPSEEQDLVVQFAQEFSKAKVDLFFCENLEQFLLDLKHYLQKRSLRQIHVVEPYLQELLKLINITFIPDLTEITAIEGAITLCESLIARTGSIVVSSHQTRSLTIYPPIHIVVAFTSQVTPDVASALHNLQQSYSSFPSLISVISGPSQTADIEKTLVLGAHGPKELTLFLVDE
ncbi:MAG: LUD domain-containing protein [Microscillaceae bacterium]|nr:LUD domain-containing protein [Microscillaceae bacterium]MDW8459830.1 LUD domain-containing protein [Cytophagales bacterium]